MRIVYWNNYYFHRDFYRYFETKYWLETNDINQYASSPCSYKIAIVGYPELSVSIDTVIENSNRVFVIMTELHDTHVDFIKKHNAQNITWVIPGRVHGIDNYVFNSEWLFEQIKLYSKPIIKQELQQLRPYQPKPYYFDSLFKTYNPHKIFVHENITGKGLTDKILMRSWNEDFIFPNDVSEGHEASLTTYKGRRCLVASIIPINIYNQSAYSIVTETQWNNTHFFLTEKVTKCLLSRRLFVMFSGQNWLRCFRELGFETFGDVIDETYDTIENDQDRWTEAFKQVEYLLSQDQVLILEKLKPVLDHNYDHMWKTNWRLILDQQIIDQIEF